MVDKSKRYAFEWFMREEDKRYWKMTKELINETEREMTMRLWISTAIFLLLTLITYVKIGIRQRKA